MEAGGTIQEAKKQGGAGGDQDLSMEEILQSIRRIIAEDDGDKKPDAPAESKSNEDVPGSDVLELTEMLSDDGSVVNVKNDPAPAEPAKEATKEAEPAAPAKQESPSDVLAKINEALSASSEPEKTEPAAAKAPEPVVAAKPVETSGNVESIISQQAASAASAQFKRIQGNAIPPEVHVPSPPFRSGTTVEDLVTEMLRPMMKEWLDNNLPQIVERIVEREVRKLAQ